MYGAIFPNVDTICGHIFPMSSMSAGWEEVTTTDVYAMKTKTIGNSRRKMLHRRLEHN